ncbi:MAG: alpha/beta hydrolase, partial [Aeromicrobium sp.]
SPDCGIRIVSWNHRGIGGSARPVDKRVDLDSYIEDAIAVMDDAGIESAVIASWSAGVTVAFELAARLPERVDGILAVAGVPGDTYATMLAPFKVPPIIAKQVMRNLTHAGKLGGTALHPVSRNIPWTTWTANMLRYSRLIRPEADTDDLRILMKEFCQTDPGWYAHLALGILRQRRISLSGIRVPVTFLAGKYDILTGSRDMLTASQRVPGSRFRELESSHFIPIEFPSIVTTELLDLLSRAHKAKTNRVADTEAAARSAPLKKAAAKKTPAKKAPAKKAAARKVPAKKTAS